MRYAYRCDHCGKVTYSYYEREHAAENYHMECVFCDVGTYVRIRKKFAQYEQAMETELRWMADRRKR